MFGFSEKKFRAFKPWHGILVGVIALLTLGVWLRSLHWPTAWIRIKDQEYRVLVADTPKHWFKGLSDRKDLTGYDGMIFIFPALEQHAMVMRDMHFPLDILWIQGDTIVDMAPNLEPDLSQTEAELRVYQGRLPSDKVLELPAGFIQEHDLRVGDEIVVAR